MPNGILGWIGLALLFFALIYHRALTTVGLLIAVAGGIYLYFYMDAPPAAVSST